MLSSKVDIIVVNHYIAVSEIYFFSRTWPSIFYKKIMYGHTKIVDEI